MSVFDKDLKPGDVIRAYNKGIHRVTKVERRFFTKEDEQKNYGKLNKEYNSLIYYDRILNGNLEPSKKLKTCCDAAFCVKLNIKSVYKEKDEKIKELEEGYQRLLDLLDE